MQEEFEAQAYLRNIRNVGPGLKARSKIINAIRINKGRNSREIASATEISYSGVAHHLRYMKAERIVEKGKQGWTLTGLGQQAVTRYLRERDQI